MRSAASIFRGMNVPVEMGGIHTSLCPAEAEKFCDVIVTGEAESVFATVLDDVLHGRGVEEGVLGQVAHQPAVLVEEEAQRHRVEVGDVVHHDDAAVVGRTMPVQPASEPLAKPGKIDSPVRGFRGPS